VPERSPVRAVIRTSGPARILITSNCLAVLGDTMLMLVLVMWVKDLTGNNAQAGGIFVALGAPALLSLLGGHVMDALAPRLALLAANAFSALALCPLFLVHGPGQVWIIYLATCLYGTGTFLYQGARASAAARAVAPQQRPTLISVLRSTRQVMTILAPSLGAIIFVTVGHQVAIGITILALILSSAISLFLHVPGTEDNAEHESYRGILAGMRHVWRSSSLRRLTSAMMVYLTVAGFFQVAVIAALGDLGASVSLLGPVATVEGVGSVAGALLAPYLYGRLSELKLVAVGLAVEACGAAVMATLTLTSVFVGAFLLGVGLPLLLVGSDTAIMNRTPTPLQGRASLAVEVVTSIPLTASFAVASLVIDMIGPVPLMSVMAVVTAISAPMAYTSETAFTFRRRKNSVGLSHAADDNASIR
jgi:MFS family permease